MKRFSFCHTAFKSSVLLPVLPLLRYVPDMLVYDNKNEIYEFISNVAPENSPIRKILPSPQ